MTTTVVGAPQRRRRPGTTLRREVVPWAFAAPAVVLFLAFMLAPILFALYLSFRGRRLSGEGAFARPEETFVGLANYLRLATDEVFRTALGTTFVYGIGLVAKTLAVIMLALPVIVLNSYKAVRHVNPSLVDMCRSFQGTRRQQIFKVIIPDASPVLFAGLRLGVAAGFIGVMLAELLITPTGIGDLITYHRSVANYAHMYAAVASIIAVSTLTLAGLQYIELRYLRPEKRRK